MEPTTSVENAAGFAIGTFVGEWSGRIVRWRAGGLAHEVEVPVGIRGFAIVEVVVSKELVEVYE